MKIALSILILLFAARLVAASDISDIKTVADVRNFLAEKVDTTWRHHPSIKDNPGDTSAYGKGKFFKIDLDQNGLTDLLVNGEQLFIIFDHGNGKYEPLYFTGDSFAYTKLYTLVSIADIDNAPALVLKRGHQPGDTGKLITKIDTLLYKFGDLIEYNATPANLHIEEIKFTTSACFGSCPIFELSITADRKVVYHAIEYNKVEGLFRSVLDIATFNRIIQTVNYIKFNTLESEYSCDWTDLQTITLEIRLSNGQIKKIRDYGSAGTYGLENLISQLFASRQKLYLTRID